MEQAGAPGAPPDTTAQEVAKLQRIVGRIAGSLDSLATSLGTVSSDLAAIKVTMNEQGSHMETLTNGYEDLQDAVAGIQQQQQQPSSGQPGSQRTPISMD